MLSNQVKNIAERIGEWAMQEKDFKYNEACDLIHDLRIKELLLVGKDILIIKTERPGMLIGKRGERINKLEEFLEKKIRIMEVENELEGWLLPEEPSCYMDDDYEYNWPDEERLLDKIFSAEHEQEDNQKHYEH